MREGSREVGTGGVTAGAGRLGRGLAGAEQMQARVRGAGLSAVRPPGSGRCGWVRAGGPAQGCPGRAVPFCWVRLETPDIPPHPAPAQRWACLCSCKAVRKVLAEQVSGFLRSQFF